MVQSNGTLNGVSNGSKRLIGGDSDLKKRKLAKTAANPARNANSYLNADEEVWRRNIR
jgi:hypothetical protein